MKLITGVLCMVLETLCRKEFGEDSIAMSVAPSTKDTYTQFICCTYRLELANGKLFYINFRNAKASDGSFTRLSSVELTEYSNSHTNIQANSLYKQHFNFAGGYPNIKSMIQECNNTLEPLITKIKNI